MRKNDREQLTAAVEAREAIVRLAKVLRDRGGQSYKLRALLFSLWNGKPASLVEIVCFDWEIRCSLCVVLLAFGYQGAGSDNFFYDQVEAAIRAEGQWEWFLEERKTKSKR